MRPHEGFCSVFQPEKLHRDSVMIGVRRAERSPALSAAPGCWAARAEPHAESLNSHCARWPRRRSLPHRRCFGAIRAPNRDDGNRIAKRSWLPSEGAEPAAMTIASTSTGEFCDTYPGFCNARCSPHHPVSRIRFPSRRRSSHLAPSRRPYRELDYALPHRYEPALDVPPIKAAPSGCASSCLARESTSLVLTGSYRVTRSANTAQTTKMP